jgi:predicted MFS family arabinose efflux permease
MAQAIANGSPITDVAALEERRHSTRVLLTLTGVALLVTYVETMVIPVIPTIQKDFSTTASVAS